MYSSVKYILVLLVGLYVLTILSPSLYIYLVENFALYPYRVRIGGEGFPLGLVSLVSYSLLHYDVWHLLFNGSFLLIFGTVIVRIFGERYFYIFLVISIVLSGIIIVLLDADSRIGVIGISGGVSALMGSLGYLGHKHPHVLVVRGRIRTSPEAVVRLCIFWLVVNVVIMFLPLSISWQGHLGGLVVGWLYTSLVYNFHKHV